MKDYFGYQNKNVVVTGASSGMGKDNSRNVSRFRCESICT